MDICVTADPGRRAAYVSAQSNAVQAGKTAEASAPGRTRDKMVISPEALAAMEKEQAGSNTTAFPSFADEFNQITQGYSDTIREHYAGEHEENLAYDDPAGHIWDKYKNPDSPDFRSGMSEDERAWAYDQEMDLLNGGRHLQMRNPYAFDCPPTLESAARQAHQACREQISQSIRELFAESGIEVPADAPFRLTVDQTYTIHVAGLKDGELAEAMEQALNRGDNGKNLYDHLKLTAPDGGTLGVDYAGGRLSDAEEMQEMDDKTLFEIKKQAGPAWARYSEIYDPHKTSMNGQVIGLNIDPGIYTPEWKERADSAVRMGMPEVLAGLRGTLPQQSLVINPDREVDPDGSIARQTYMRAYAQSAENARKVITEYYADAHRENSAYPFPEALDHIAAKYKWPDSPIFRSDLTEDQRNTYYRQERALLTGSRLTLYDPYALASVGGLLTAEECHQYAMQAVREKMAELRANLG